MRVGGTASISLATAAVFNDSLISRYFRVSISAKRIIIGSDRQSKSK